MLRCTDVFQDFLDFIRPALFHGFKDTVFNNFTYKIDRFLPGRFDDIPLRFCIKV